MTDSPTAGRAPAAVALEVHAPGVHRHTLADHVHQGLYQPYAFKTGLQPKFENACLSRIVLGSLIFDCHFAVQKTNQPLYTGFPNVFQPNISVKTDTQE